ncbi:MAG: hypothetical protein ABI222_18110 [Opitutaceae bacterium]
MSAEAMAKVAAIQLDRHGALRAPRDDKGKSSRRGDKTSQGAPAVSDWILHFVQNDKPGLKTCPEVLGAAGRAELRTLHAISLVKRAARDANHPCAWPLSA